MKLIFSGIILMILFVSASFEVNAQCSCSLPQPPLTGGMSSANAHSSFSIIGVVTISGNVTFLDDRITMGSGAQIVVPNGQSLTIDGSWLHGCGCMWAGIVVQAGGKLTVKNASIIEDALTAIDNTESGTLPNNLSVTQTLFNKNRTAILLRRDFASPPTGAAVLDNNVFTCRNGINYTNGSNHLLGNPTYFNNTLKNNFLTLFNNLPYQTTTTNQGLRSATGIFLRGFLPGFAHDITNSVFDYLDYGMVAGGSDINVYGNQFSNMPGTGLTSTTSGVTIKGTGIGVYAFGVDPPFNSAKIGVNNRNYFYNLFRGVDINTYLNVKVDGNTFENKTTDDFGNFNSIGAWYGQCAIQLTAGQLFNNYVSAPHPNYQVTENLVLYYATGIHVMRFYYNTAGITISCNQVGIPSSFNNNTKYLWQGIAIEDLPGGTGSTTLNQIQIIYNSVCKALQNCIIATGVKNGNGLYIKGNGDGTAPNNYLYQPEVTLAALNSFPHQQNSTTAAIAAIDCMHGQIRCNVVGGPSYQMMGKIPQGYSYGILCDMSPDMKVIDNIVDRHNFSKGFINGIDFRNNCFPAQCYNNAIRHGFNGLVLENTSIGQQGAPGSWRVMELSNLTWQTAVDPWTSPLSPDPNYNSQYYLYSNYIPINNYGVLTGCNVLGKRYESSSGCTSLGLNQPSQQTNWSFYYCFFSPALQDPPCGTPPPLPPHSPLRAGQIDTALTDTIGASIGEQNRIFHTKRFIWESMLNDNLYNTANPSAQSFYMQNANTALGRFALTENALTAGDITTAQNQNSFVAGNNFELKQQEINRIKIKMLDTTQGNPLDGNDSLTLKSIANGCPETDGRAFWEARTMMNILYGQPLHFTSNCQSGNNYRYIGDPESLISEKSFATIFPNPNTGTFQINYDLGDEKNNGIFSIFDISGKLIKTDVLKSDQLSMEVDLGKVPAGLYLYKIVVAGKCVQNGKLAVTD